MVSDTAFIFHIYIPWGKTLSLDQSQGHLSRLNNKVTVFEKKMTVAGAFVFHKRILFVR